MDTYGLHKKVREKMRITLCPATPEPRVSRFSYALCHCTGTLGHSAVKRACEGHEAAAAVRSGHRWCHDSRRGTSQEGGPEQLALLGLGVGARWNGDALRFVQDMLILFTILLSPTCHRMS